MKKINILFAPIHYILDKENTGSEFSWAYEIYKRLTKEPNINSIFISGGTRGIQNDHVIDCKIFLPEKLNLSITKIFIFYFKVFLETISIIISKKIDIIHHVLPFYIGKSFNIAGILLNKNFIVGPIQSPLVVLDTDLSLKDARGFDKSDKHIFNFILPHIINTLNPVLNILSQITLKKAKKLIVINKKTRDILIKKGIKEENIVIIPPGIEKNKFKYVNYDSKKTDTIKLLATGYLLNRKGFDIILKAIAMINNHNKKKLELTIVGDGPQMSNLQNLVKELEIKQYVKFAGFIPNCDIHKYYERAHIYVNMSYAEGFATVCLEAMASGLAIISSKVGGFEDAIKDGFNGYIINKGDYKELAEKINYLIQNEKIIQRIGKNARETIVKNYDWDDNIIPQYIKIYSKV